MTQKEITITEALAEIKTIGRRIAKKQEFVGKHLLRQNNVKDPLESDGGSSAVIKSELQAMADLQQRIIDIRSAISRANAECVLTIVAVNDRSISQTVTDWLVWRREIAPLRTGFLRELNSGITQHRASAQRKGQQLTSEDKAGDPQDIVVHLSETELASEIETMEDVLGQLDGKLSLHNATTTVEV